MQFKKGIVIAGMHGKTTTSSMTAHIMRVGGLNPSHYVGAEIPILGTNAHWEPNGGYLVAEGDESDGTLSIYHAEHAIILNIEEEHLDYYADLAAIEKVFNRFLDQITGKVVYCADDSHAVTLGHRDEVGDAIRGIDEQDFTALAVTDEVGEVDHLRGHLVTDGEVAARQQLPEIKAIGHAPMVGTRAFSLRSHVPVVDCRGANRPSRWRSWLN